MTETVGMTLKEEFEGQMWWREEKAEQYPNDKRNLETVEIFKRLAATANDVPRSLMDEYEAVFLRWETDEVVSMHSEALRAVGFHSSPENATEFVRDFVESVNAERRRFEDVSVSLVAT
jgi:hypothetical protein